MQKGYSETKYKNTFNAKLYKTFVVVVEPAFIDFNSGSWITPSTAKAMNTGLTSAGIDYLKVNIKQGQFIVTDLRNGTKHAFTEKLSLAL